MRLCSFPENHEEEDEKGLKKGWLVMKGECGEGV